MYLSQSLSIDLGRRPDDENEYKINFNTMKANHNQIQEMR